MKKIFMVGSCVRAIYAFKGTGLRHVIRFICRLGEQMGRNIHWGGSCFGSQLKARPSWLRPRRVILHGGGNQAEFTMFSEVQHTGCDDCLLRLKLGWLQPFQDILATPRP